MRGRDAVIAEARKLVPNKPIKYLINTHHHFDHFGGVRAYVAEGATIITKEANVAYYQKALHRSAHSRSGRPGQEPQGSDHRPGEGKVRPYRRRPDRDLSRDGDRHAADLTFYLPKAKVLVEADDYTPYLPQVPAPGGIRPPVFSANLMKKVQRLKLDVTTIAPMHGIVVPFSDFQKAENAGKG